MVILHKLHPIKTSFRKLPESKAMPWEMRVIIRNLLPLETLGEIPDKRFAPQAQLGLTNFPG